MCGGARSDKSDVADRDIASLGQEQALVVTYRAAEDGAGARAFDDKIVGIPADAVGIAAGRDADDIARFGGPSGLAGKRKGQARTDGEDSRFRRGLLGGAVPQQGRQQKRQRSPLDHDSPLKIRSDHSVRQAGLQPGRGRSCD
jgi:hypothetical protein